jgi:hypothetical protein
LNLLISPPVAASYKAGHDQFNALVLIVDNCIYYGNDIVVYF